MALIVSVWEVGHFLCRERIVNREELTLAVFDDPLMVELASQLLPHARRVVIHSYDELPANPNVDAALWILEQARVWTYSRPEYTAVVSRDLVGRQLSACLMPADGIHFR